ncbi:MAG: DUF4365 domain-containing protein [Spirochaetaceae bacterium]|jgi:hypothetical protein|nr:DUF4365 domain-containing protein [Spirochaetaceae bacterium]
MDKNIKLPQRTKEHQKEEMGFNKFKSLLYPTWILHDMRGKDYGLDVIIEMVSTDNEVLPYKIGIQIKYREYISKSITIKIGTFNYLSRSNIPTFIFVTNNTKSKIIYMNNMNINKQKRAISLADNLFAYISDQQDLTNEIQKHTTVSLFEKDIMIKISKGTKIFPEISAIIRNGNDQEIKNIYLSNINLIHPICAYYLANIKYYKVYLQNDIQYDDIKRVNGDINTIKDMLLVFLIVIAIYSKKHDFNISERARNEFMLYLKKIGSSRLMVGKGEIC